MDTVKKTSLNGSLYSSCYSSLSDPCSLKIAIHSVGGRAVLREGAFITEVRI